MKFKLTILLAATVLSAGAILSLDAQAYTRFDGDNNCSQCHTGFNGFSGATHQLHTGNGIGCLSCHDSSGDNPRVEKCAVCHESNPLWNTHLNSAGPDGEGFTCATCHTVTPNERWNWSSAKRTFH